MQTAIVLILVAACALYVAWQLTRTLSGGTGKAGACCGKGCAAQPAPPKSGDQFIAVDLLRHKKRP